MHKGNGSFAFPHLDCVLGVTLESNASRWLGAGAAVRFTK